MHEFSLKVGDTRPSISAQLLDDNNDPRDLQAVDTIRFHMERVDDGEVIVDSAATIVNESEGKVAYEWQDGDTDTVGRYEAEFEVNYTNSGIETFPNDGYINVNITDDIA